MSGRLEELDTLVLVVVGGGGGGGAATPDQKRVGNNRTGTIVFDHLDEG